MSIKWGWVFDLINLRTFTEFEKGEGEGEWDLFKKKSLNFFYRIGHKQFLT